MFPSPRTQHPELGESHGNSRSVSGFLILGYLAFRKFTGHEILVEHGPLLLAGSLLLLAGIMMFTTGLLGEVLVRIYAIREIRTRGEARQPERTP